jgi:hypothetical protein
MSALETYYDPNATPRDRALAACELARDASEHPEGCDESDPVRRGLWLENAVKLAVETGVANPAKLSLDELEAALREIKYTALTLEMPTEAIERLLALPEWLRKSLGIVGIRPMKEEK